MGRQLPLSAIHYSGKVVPITVPRPARSCAWWGLKARGSRRYRGLGLYNEPLRCNCRPHHVGIVIPCSSKVYNRQQSALPSPNQEGLKLTIYLDRSDCGTRGILRHTQPTERGSSLYVLPLPLIAQILLVQRGTHCPGEDCVAPHPVLAQRCRTALSSNSIL